MLKKKPKQTNNHIFSCFPLKYYALLYLNIYSTWIPSFKFIFSCQLQSHCHLNAMKITKLHTSLHEGLVWKQYAGQKSDWNLPSSPHLTHLCSASQSRRRSYILDALSFLHTSHASDSKPTYSPKQLPTWIFVQLKIHPLCVIDRYETDTHIFKMTQPAREKAYLN